MKRKILIAVICLLLAGAIATGIAVPIVKAQRKQIQEDLNLYKDLKDAVRDYSYEMAEAAEKYLSEEEYEEFIFEVFEDYLKYNMLATEKSIEIAAKYMSAVQYKKYIKEANMEIIKLLYIVLDEQTAEAMMYMSDEEANQYVEDIKKLANELIEDLKQMEE